MNQFQHIRSQEFVALENKLPVEIRRTVAKQFQLLQTYQSYPSLRFKKVLGDGRSVLRTTIGLWDTDMRTRSRGYWIGTHAEYERQISKPL